MNFEDDIRRALRDAGRPAAATTEAWDAIVTRVDPRSGPVASRDRGRVLVAAAVVAVLVALVVTVLARRAGDRSGLVDTAGQDGELTPVQLLPWTTGTTLLLDDGFDGVVAVDLDTGAAVRRPLPGKAPGNEPVRLAVVGDKLVYPGGGHIHAIDLDLVSRPVDLGEGIGFLPAGDAQQIWRIQDLPPTASTGTPGHRWERVDLDGNAIPLQAESDATIDHVGPPSVGLTDGLLVAFSPGWFWWDVNGRSGTPDSHVQEASVPALGPDSNAARCADPVAHHRTLAVLSGPVGSTTCDDVTIVDMDGGGRRTVAPHEGGQPAVMAFSPDGSRLALTPRPGAPAASAGGGLEIVDAATGRTHRSVSDTPWGDDLLWSPDGSKLFATAVVGDPGAQHLRLTAATDPTTGADETETTLDLPIGQATAHAVAVPSRLGPDLEQPGLRPCPTAAIEPLRVGGPFSPGVTTTPCRLSVDGPSPVRWAPGRTSPTSPSSVTSAATATTGAAPTNPVPTDRTDPPPSSPPGTDPAGALDPGASGAATSSTLEPHGSEPRAI